MIIMVRLDYQGEDLQNDLKKLKDINSKIEAKIAGKDRRPILSSAEYTPLHIPRRQVRAAE